jgi:PAS domain S-box-containing protein
MTPGLFTSALLLMSGIAFVYALTFLLDWLYNKRRSDSLAFSVFCLLTSIQAATLFFEYHANSVGAYIILSKIEYGVVFLISLSMVWFLADLTRVNARWWLIILTPIIGILFAYNFLSRYPLNASEIYGIKAMTLPWGEQVMAADYKVSWIIPIAAIVLLLIIISYFVICFLGRRSLGTIELLVLLVCIGMFVAAAISRIVFELEATHFLILGPFARLGLMLLMGTMLSMRHGRQSLELVATNTALTEEMENRRFAENGRKRVEEAMRESEERYRAVIEATNTGFVALDEQGRVLNANLNYAQMVGCPSVDKIIGRQIMEWTAPYDIERNRAEVGKCFEKGAVKGLEIDYKRADGTIVPIEINANVVQTKNGRMILTLCLDITERKRAEKKIFEYQKRLKQLAAQLTLVEEQERRRIASELHDEISQTLAMAKNKLDVLRNSPPSEGSSAEMEQISSYIKKVLQETRTLTFELSNPILYELGFELAVADWLRKNVQEKHGITTAFHDDKLPKPLDDDLKAMLFRNIRELLTNCIKHAKAEKIRVSILRIDDSIQVIVEDNGIGFDHAQVRTVTGKKASFGLFSIRENMENISGYFEIESKPGAGCKAIMTAPLKSQKDKKEG